MARLESIAKAGYYPAPVDLVDRIARMVVPVSPQSSTFGRVYVAHAITDPCAGEGEALKTLIRAWFGKQRLSEVPARVYACELEKTRAERLRDTLGYDYHVKVAHGDAFALLTSAAQQSTQGKEAGSTILWLNPPYDTDKEFGRLEERWLARHSDLLMAGGLLMFLVPGYAVAASATTLATQYEQVRIYRVPAEHYSSWKQVIVFGVKRGMIAQIPDPEVLARATAAPDTWPELPEAPTPTQVYRPEPKSHSGFAEWDVGRVDIRSLISVCKPWTIVRGAKAQRLEKVEPSVDFKSVCLRTYRVAVPPRAAHIAAGITAGVFNGARIVSDVPGLPPLYIKGTYSREWHTEETRYTKDGEVSSVVQVQRPRLNITALDASTFELHRLAPSTELTGSTAIDGAFTIGDLLHNYGDSLLSTLRARCPTLYDYSEAQRAYDSPRTMFSAQNHATAACLRLLDQPDKAAFLLGEIGSGKSTVSLITAHTYLEEKRPGKQHRILVVLPPHLVTEWPKQVEAVLPSAKVVQIDSIDALNSIAADTETHTIVGVMSRETAKLGHAYDGLAACGKCGYADPKVTPDAAVRLRKRCAHIRTSPANRAARILLDLAHASYACAPSDELMRSVVSPRIRQSMDKLAATNKASLSPSQSLVRSALFATAKMVGRAHREGANTEYDVIKAMHQALIALVLVFDHVPYTEQAIETVLEVSKAEARELQGWGNDGSLKELLRALTLCLEPGGDAQKRMEERLSKLKGASSYYSSGSDTFANGSYLMSKRVLSGHATAGDYFSSSNIMTYDESSGDLRVAQAAPRTFAMLKVAMQTLSAMARWDIGKPCGEPLYCAVPRPLRYPLARFITKRMPHVFDFLIVDEAHEYANQDSAQSQAVQQLYGLHLPTLVLTGSVTNGYASSLFVPLWYNSRDFRDVFKRGEIDKFVKMYGYVRRVVEVSGKIKEHGAMSSRKEVARTVGQVAGVMPEVVLRYLLPLAVTVHLEDIEGETIPGADGPIKLPKAVETVIRVAPLPEQMAKYERLKTRLLEQIKADRFTDRQGKLFGQLAELPSCLDRLTSDVGSVSGDGGIPDGFYTVAYPDGDVVERVACFPESTLLPKEQELITQVARAKAQGRRVMVFPWHIALMPRLARILRGKGYVVAELYSSKVPPKKRQAWIEKEVLRRGVDVLIVNPVAVQTGLNNLVYFSTVIWYENPGCSPNIFRQAKGRVKRIGQVLDVESITLIYDHTLQESLLKLLMHKVGISEAVDGLDPTAALEAAGVGDTDTALSQSIGKALYAMIDRS